MKDAIGDDGERHPVQPGGQGDDACFALSGELPPAQKRPNLCIVSPHHIEPA